MASNPKDVNVVDELERIGADVRQRFAAEKRVLSFREYLDLLHQHPERHTRDASRYLRDCFRHYGSYDVDGPFGKRKRYRLFDLPFESASAAFEGDGRLIGHEAIQDAFYQILEGFGRGSGANRLVLLHGPNGSAKSTFTRCLMRALEDFSTRDEGALYRFSWIFPRGTDSGGIGFGAVARSTRAGESYAHLPEERVDAKLPSALREHPLFLLPARERGGLVAKLFEKSGTGATVPEWILRGRLGSMNKLVFEALLTAYRGDLDRVLAHVQVERWYISASYRVGAVTIGPQMSVDARERQITADRTLGSLPASLSAVTLFEPEGELVDASGGLLEYSDLLKRPLEAWKYLLLAIETGEISLPLSNLPLNAVMVGSSNELHLTAFKQHPEYNSFRGRISLLRVPYLLDYRSEQSIYDAQILPRVRKHVAPHTSYVASLWAVLTRMRRVQVERFGDPAVGRLAADLTPLEKAELYAEGRIPSRLGSDAAQQLRGAIGEIGEVSAAAETYEGLVGASPREIRSILLDAAVDEADVCLSPLAVLSRIESFCRRDDYDFLREGPDSGYYDALGFVGQVRRRWLDRVDAELRESSGFVEETQYRALFERYVTHVSFWIKNERVYNRVTGSYEDPDLDLMQNIESMIGVGDSTNFRNDLINKVGAHALDYPGETLQYAEIFPSYVDRVREHYFAKRRKQLRELLTDLLRELEGSAPPEGERGVAAAQALERLKERSGYEAASAKIALAELLTDRYAR